jgi:hypothetical protein
MSDPDYIEPGYTRNPIDCLFNGGHLWHTENGVMTCDYCGVSHRAKGEGA